jgi:hypothetical protein
MRGRWTVLRAMRAPDVEAVAAIQEETGVAPWRRGPGAVPPSSTEGAVWQNVDVQLVVAPVDDPDTVLGVCIVYALDPRSGFAYLAAAYAQDQPPAVAPVEALGLVIEHAFDRFAPRKLLVEVTDASLAALGRLERFGFTCDATTPAGVGAQLRVWCRCTCSPSDAGTGTRPRHAPGSHGQVVSVRPDRRDGRAGDANRRVQPLRCPGQRRGGSGRRPASRITSGSHTGHRSRRRGQGAPARLAGTAHVAAAA